MDEPSEYERARADLHRLSAELVVEADAGPLSETLGRPSVTVCDRYLDVGLQEERPPLERVIGEIRGFELSCPECPQRVDEASGNY
jgi:hypothetical protein